MFIISAVCFMSVIFLNDTGRGGCLCCCVEEHLPFVKCRSEVG